ncbi:SAM-dependent methyltransferase [Amycolatopsis thailandensis]|uniref:SAM-dependent methyltransferase n=1 Tax=Amycolatopsis thailandensis TaxID=589330 RepID=UPI00363CD995
MSEHPSTPGTTLVSDLGDPQWITTRARVRAAFGGGLGDPSAHAAADRIRACMPTNDAAIEAEHDARDRALAQAYEAGIRNYVVLDPDLPPWTPMHQQLPAGSGCRVLYLLDDDEPAVRSWIVATCQGDTNVRWRSSYPDIASCLRVASLTGDISLTEPVCVLLSTALQHTQEPHAVVAGLWNVLPGGSWVSVTQLPPREPAPAANTERSPVEIQFRNSTRSPLVLRSASELVQLFTEPRRWDITRSSRVELRAGNLAPPGDDARPSTVHAVSELLTLTARRPRSSEPVPPNATTPRTEGAAP